MLLRKKLLTTVAACAVAVPALAPRVASADPVSRSVPFTTISKSAFGSRQAQQVVIQDEAAYRAFFDGNPPATPAVDFARETVLAVAMGAQRSGGYSVEIESVTQMLQGITGGMVFVKYVERSPAPGTMVPFVITFPVHVVKIRKLTGVRFVFTKDAAAAQSFTTLRLDLRNTSATPHRTLTLSADGSARFERDSLNGLFAPVTGQATPQELSAVKGAFARADVATLPPFVPDPRMLMGGTSIELDSTVGGRTYKFNASLDFYAGVTPRVKPLVDALLAIERRLASPATATSFTRLTLHAENPMSRFDQTITIEANGDVRVVDEVLGSRVAARQTTGRATQDELRALEAAFRAADVDTLPRTLPGMVMDGTTMKLLSEVGSQSYSLNGFLGFYGSYAPRVKPLVDAIEAIAKRVTAGSEERQVRGLALLSAGGVNIEENRSSILKVTNEPFARLVSSATGKYVTAFGRVTKTNPFGGTIEVEWLIGGADRTLLVRDAANPRAPIVGSIRAAFDVKIVGVEGAWYKVRLAGGRSGYVPASGVTIGDGLFRGTPTPGITGTVPR